MIEDQSIKTKLIRKHYGFHNFTCAQSTFNFTFNKFSLFTVGCEDDDHDEHGHEEGHTDAEGFKLEDENGNEVYSQFEGAIEGAITLNVGETLELTVHFLDDDGNEMNMKKKKKVKIMKTV